MRDTATCGHITVYEKLLDKYYPGQPSLGICMYDSGVLTETQLQRVIEAHRLVLIAPTPNRRTSNTERDCVRRIIFDRESARLFHYTLQEAGNSKPLNLGQESSLTGATDAVEAALRRLNRPDA